MQNHAAPQARALCEQLQLGPRTARDLMATLGISQSTVSRTLQALGDQVITIGAARSMQYALHDPERAELATEVYRVTPAGQLQELGALVPVQPEGFVLMEPSGKHVHFDALPWWAADLRPQGYLGQAFVLRHGPALDLPARLVDWSGTQILRTLIAQGDDLPGHLLIGSAARERFINGAPPAPIAPNDIPQAYGALAQAATQGELPASGAAGEQPKFTACIQREDGHAAQVIVKFSSAVASPVSARWRDLLLAEHLALEVLRDAGIPAARSRIVDHGPQRFLEVERFDRIEDRGRRGMHSLAALDAQFVGTGGRWPAAVRSLVRRKVVAPDALPGAELLWAFGALIGNTDMHSGNLSFLAEGGPRYQLAPAYDMTPMVFAPTAGGELPIRDLELDVGTQVPARAWLKALPLAREFVRRLRTSPGFTGDFGSCIAILSGHVGVAQERIERLAA